MHISPVVAFFSFCYYGNNNRAVTAYIWEYLFFFVFLLLLFFILARRFLISFGISIFLLAHLRKRYLLLATEGVITFFTWYGC